MNRSLRVLIVEDSADDTLLLIRALSKGGYTVTHRQVETAPAMQAALELQEWDLVLADYSLPQFSAPAALTLMQSLHLDLPFIVVSGTIADEQAVAAMMLGAHDYMMKDKLARLLPAVEREIREAAERHKRQQAERALQQSEQRFRALIENTSDIIILLDTTGIVHYASPSVWRLLGYAPQELEGQLLSTWLHPEDEPRAMKTLVNTLIVPGTTVTLELRWQKQQGGWRVLEAIAKQFEDSTGFSGVVINARDITERLRMEEIRRALAREKELSELKLNFFSMASHEFRTPLGIILMAANVLENSDPEWLDPKKLRNLDRIQNSAKQLRQALTDVLTVARMDAQKLEFNPKPFNLQEFCPRILADYRANHTLNPQIRFTYTGSSRDVCMDQMLLESIITNLLSNAIKYSLPGREVDFQVTLQTESALFTVKDGGIGIPVTDQAHLFEPFHRGENVGKIEGSGLGLAIVKRCVDLHGGQITVDSTLGVGTVFRVQIPTNL